MPANTASSKHYRVVVPANSTVNGGLRASPATPGRKALWIQNTGANPVLIHFEKAIQNDLSDFSLAAGAFLNLDQAGTCPTEALNVGSVVGTTVSILEMTE